MMSALERGLDISTVRRMTMGQVVDFVIEYNNRQEKANSKEPSKRWATQSDINAFLGG